jgi:hypothetical protein
LRGNLIFSFEGKLTDRELEDADYSKEHLLISLESHRNEISQEIEREIQNRLPYIPFETAVNVHIGFSDGSVQWDGVVEFLDWMARIGGSLGLIGIITHTIRTAINKVLVKRIPRVQPNTIVIFAGLINPAHRPHNWKERLLGVLVIGNIWILMVFIFSAIARRSECTAWLIETHVLEIISFGLSAIAIILALISYWRTLD